MSLRGLGLAGRFGLMLYLVRFMDFKSVAVFGFVYAGVAMAPAVLNLGIHFRTSRQNVGASFADVGQRLRDRLILHLAVYFPLALAIIIAARATDFLSAVSLTFIVATALICILDVFLNEIHLVLISCRQPIGANVVLFVRSASWVFPFIGFSWCFAGLRSLDALLIFWLGGQILALGVFGIVVRRWPWGEILSRPTAFHWLLQGFKTSCLLWLSDIGMSLGQFIDRFILGNFLDIQLTGIFIFFWSLANGIYQLAYTAIVQIAQPTFVLSARHDDHRAFRRLLLAEMRNVTVFTLLIGGAMVFALPVFGQITGREVLADQSLLFCQIIIGMAIRLASDVAGIGIYARGLDIAVAGINLATPVISALFMASALTIWQFDGIGPAFIATPLVVLVARLYILKNVVG